MSSKRRALAAAAFCSGSLLGCGSSTEDRPPSASPSDAGGIEAGENLDAASDADADAPFDPFRPCPERTGGTGDGAECATFQLPLRWSDPSGPTIAIFVKRFRATGKRRGALWLLQGGPGGPGSDFEDYAPQQATHDPTLDVYLPDHRGTGRSTFLECPEQEAPSSPGGPGITPEEAAACVAAVRAKAGHGIFTGITTTDAARDLEALIARTRAPSDRVFVYGVSYGSYWAQRYMQVAPKQASGVIVDAMCMPGECDLSLMDAWHDDGAKRFFATCGDDPVCNSKLGGDAWAKLTVLEAKLRLGYCPGAIAAGFGIGNFKALLVTLTSYGGFDLRPLAAALVYRIDRCTEDDVRGVRRLFEVLSTAGLTAGITGPGFSQVTQLTIGLSELFPDPPPPLESLTSTYESARVAGGGSVGLRQLYDVWPRYARDELVGHWATSTIPILMIHGELDFIPLAAAETAKLHFGGDAQTFVPIPRAPHAAWFQSPTKHGEGWPCGMQIGWSFLADETALPDTSCLSAIDEIDYASRAALSNWFFSTPDMWEGVPTEVKPARLPMRLQLHVDAAARAFARLRMERAWMGG
jgi:pimeloyl-ACP methyl ester carboxylesterase